ncbi:MAG: glycosyltransferase, partial [Gemmatimonadota bacterium]
MPDGCELSVVLPCHNAAATIREQLEALERQEWPGGWELIVVDNMCTDASMDIARAFADRIP